MNTVTRTFETEAEAEAFCAGVEYVNDSACYATREGRVVTIHDEDLPDDEEPAP